MILNDSRFSEPTVIGNAGETPKETVQNVAEAMSALLSLMAHQHSDLCRLMSPMLAALETVANDGD